MPLAFIAILSALIPPVPAEQAAPESPTPALFLSLGLGVDALASNWRERNPSIDGELRQLGPAIRLAAGVQLGS